MQATITRLLLALLPLLVVSSQAGCSSADFDYGTPPVIKPSNDPVVQCVQKGMIRVSPAEAQWTLVQKDTDITGNIKTTTTTTTDYTVKGLSFYKNTKRLDADEALLELGDIELAEAYAPNYLVRKNQ